MELDELLERALDLPKPWKYVSAELDETGERVEIRVVYEESRAPCPKCGQESPRHDSQERRWRHLNLWDYQTWITCSIPRVKCSEHGVRKLQVPWADGWSRFTAGFECMVIDWLREASVSAVARYFALTWDQVYGIQKRAVDRGLARREREVPKRIGVDETSFQKRHEYVTVVTDLDSGKVLHVADGRGKEALEGFFRAYSRKELAGLDVVAMDMHAPYIVAAATHVPGLADKLCFDRFHVAQLFGKAVDQTRRAEHKRLSAQGDTRLKGTRYLWLWAAKELPKGLRKRLVHVLSAATEVSKVWSIKEAASKLWSFQSRAWAQKAWLKLCKAALSLEIPALTRATNTCLNHMIGIVNAIVLKVTNARSESINSRIQSLKRRANGYRNRARFRAAILFHLGRLNLYPDPGFHSKA